MHSPIKFEDGCWKELMGIQKFHHLNDRKQFDSLPKNQNNADVEGQSGGDRLAIAYINKFEA